MITRQASRLFSRLTPILVCLSLLAAGREDAWKEVETAANKGLPKTAIEKLEPIISAAVEEKAWPEATRAIARKISLERRIQGHKAEEAILLLEDEIKSVPPEVQPVIQAILANWYWDFFNQNRWRFAQRTRTSGRPGDDILSWDLPTILEKIDSVFTAALRHSDMLKNTPVSDYDELLEKGTVPDAYRPTLYDFIAHEAIAFYAAGEQAGAAAQDEFEIAAEDPIFAPVFNFMKWRAGAPEGYSPLQKAIGLYQDLLEFHEHDDDRSAFEDINLARLALGRAYAIGDKDNAAYLAALDRFIERNRNHEIAARALYMQASNCFEKNDRGRAHELASEGVQAYPESVGGRMCYNLIQTIEAPEFEIMAERVWNDPFPPISVKHRNLDRLYFRVVKEDFEKLLKRDAPYNPGSIRYNEEERLLKLKPVREWSVRLEPAPDFSDRIHEEPAPTDLQPGYYCLLVSGEPDFNTDTNRIVASRFWASDIALVQRHDRRNQEMQGLVLNAKTGNPISNAHIRVWRRERDRYLESTPCRTDNDGFFRVESTVRGNYLILAEANGHKISSMNPAYLHDPFDPDKPYSRTVFFTDRSLYRPGQAIRYKGISYRSEKKEGVYKTLPNDRVTVIFSDANGKEISRQTQESNDFGSFSGSFTAPRDRLMGRMRIHCGGAAKGSTYINVEEYKRPKFKVELSPPKDSPRLGGKVFVHGESLAYTGAPIGNARVSWRVVREVNFPRWWNPRWHLHPGSYGESKEIAHGYLTTENDGSFEISFTAEPDRSVPRAGEPRFVFSVHADVTDINGETRSSRLPVTLGYTGIQAVMEADKWQIISEPVRISIRTSTLDGIPQQADCKFSVYALQQPDRTHRKKLESNLYHYFTGSITTGSKGSEPEADPADPSTWSIGRLMTERTLRTGTNGNSSLEVSLPPGQYRALLETSDSAGNPATARLPIRVLDPKADTFPIRAPSSFQARSWNLEPGDEFMALWGTGYDAGRAFVEFEKDGRLLDSWWTDPNATQVAIKRKIGEDMRGGITLRVTYVRENRAYIEQHTINVPWSNKNLALTWKRFRSELEPGSQEKWVAEIKGPNAQAAAAEAVATLYDASLDAYLPHNWPRGFGVFPTESSHMYLQLQNSLKTFQEIHDLWRAKQKSATWRYRHFPDQIIASRGDHSLRVFDSAVGSGIRARSSLARADSAQVLRSPVVMKDMCLRPMVSAVREEDKLIESNEPHRTGPKGDAREASDTDKVQARRNLNETAFFFPHLVSKDDGTVEMEFTMPEAVTEWNLMCFAHDRDLRAGFLDGKAVTSKDLMIEPNPPRFVREGDEIEFVVKVTNRSATNQAGLVELTFASARTGDSMNDRLGLKRTGKDFDVPAGESRSYSWRITVPDGMEFMTYRAVGTAGNLSDGEESFLPVLSRRVLVTESLPLPIRGKQEKIFKFEKLLASGESDTLRHQSLTAQMVSNPSWYAVMALPYLIEFPHECLEQIFNRLYANSLARHIANSDPKIRRVFDLWRGTPALDSPLLKNEEMKAVMIEETPWLRQALAEGEARRNVGILFDANRLDRETERLMHKLAAMQGDNGLWPWFPGGRSDRRISLYIATGFGRMRRLGIDTDVTPAIRALDALDAWIDETYRRILKDGDKDSNNLTPTIAFYLYGRSFFMDDQSVARAHREAFDYFVGQAKQHWLHLGNRQSKAHVALGLNRLGDTETPQSIMASIREHALVEEEMGMYWRDTELSWSWFRAPIETQALMIEAFDEVMGDAEAVENCGVWLLKQKQTRDWKTTKATADAVYALLLRGTDTLASDELVEMRVGSEVIKPENIEAGTGFYEKRFPPDRIKPEMGKVVLNKSNEGVAWGSIHWQYLESLEKITPHEQTPLKINKRIYRRVNTSAGPELQLVESPVSVGDELVVRVEIRTDRDMEYIHLKDQRGSGTEPVNVISRYKYMDGLGYYESTRDTASHFYIDYLPKGTYVFEYSTHAVHAGEYQSGIAHIECMYAPEFNSHSESHLLRVRQRAADSGDG